MNILLLTRWKLTDVLTASTVVPQLEALVQLGCVNKIIYHTIEESRVSISENAGYYDILNNEKVLWVPVVSFSGPVKLLNQIADTLLHTAQLTKIAKENDVQRIIAYGAPAGIFAILIGEKLNLPFYVSSFEPHAAYMAESGVWSRHGIKYIFQSYWEQQQKKKAAGLMPVAENYRRSLLEEGISPEKVITVPCAINFNITKFDQRHKDKIREQLGWQNATIGIYVGKFGGLYFKDESFLMYGLCFKIIPDFRLIILSPQDKQEIVQLLQKYSINLEMVFVASVPHHEVFHYLSAADFAFATIKSYPSGRYCSPVKIGEYWASGLPVLLTEGIGDDSDIISTEGGGALFNLTEPGSVEKAIKRIQAIIAEPNHREQIRKLAVKYRSPDRIKEAYAYFLGEEANE